MKPLLFILFLAISISYSAQCEDDFNQFVETQFEELKNDPKSPLLEEERRKLKGLDYYDFDGKYCVRAYLKLTPDAVPFEMVTSTDRRPMYVQYATCHFKLNGEEQVLALYQSVKHMEMEEYKDDLFLPFGDKTNGDGTYGGGRFIDLKIPEVNEMGMRMVQLDFNSSYNPYCAYNHDYSCPAPPKENILDIPIPAGVKGLKFKK